MWRKNEVEINQRWPKVIPFKAHQMNFGSERTHDGRLFSAPTLAPSVCGENMAITISHSLLRDLRGRGAQKKK